MWRLCEDHPNEFEIANYKRFVTLTEVIDTVIDSDDEGEHETVIITPKQGNGNVTDREERDENDVANSLNAELPNDVAGTLEVHKNFDGDCNAIIKNGKPKSKRKKVRQSVNWKKNTTLTELPKGKV